MLSKNNYQERLRKMERKQERFSIRKFSVGAASVLIGVLFFMNEGPTNHVVHASELTGQNITVKADTSKTSAKPEADSQAPVKQTAEDTTKSVATEKAQPTSENATPESEALKSDAVKSDAPKSEEVKSVATKADEKTDNKDAKSTETTALKLNTKDLAKGNGSLDSLIKANKLAKTAVTDEHTANVENFADLSKAIANKDITTINLNQDIDLTNMTEEQSQVDGGLVSGGTGLTGDNWLQPYELAANKTSNSPFTSIARDLTVNGNDHTVNMGKWFISLWNQNQDNTNGWKLTFNDVKVKNNSTSTRYTPIYFGNMNSANLKKVTLTFNNFQADLNTPLTNDEDGVDVIFKGKDVINVSPLANNATGSIEQGADRNIIFARNVLIDDNADVSITASMTGSFGIGGLTSGVQDEEHNVIKLSPDTSDSSDPAGSMAVGKNAKLTINTNGIDGKGSTTSLRGIASRNANGTLTLNEGATVNMTLGKGHSSAVLLSNLDLKKGSTLNIDTMQDNNGFSQRMSGNMGSDGWIYAPIALGAISFSQTGNARLTVADGATLKMKRGNVKTSTAMIQLGGSTVFGGQAYDLEFADGSTIDIQDASDNEGMTLGIGGIGIATGKKDAYSPLINIMKTSKVGTIGQVKYLNLQRTNPNGYSVGNLIDAASGLHMDAGKFGGVDVKQWDKGNNNADPNKTWQVENFSEESSGKINAAGMAPVDNNKLNDFLSSVNFVKGTQQRLVLTSMDLESYKYDARYKDSTAKVGETINIDSPTFYQVGEDGTLTPANPNPDLLDNTMSGHPYQLGWVQTGNVTIPQGATIDSATGKITFAANQGQVGTVVNIPVTVTYKDDSIDQVIAPVYVLGNDTTPVWQKDENGNTTGAVAIQYAAGNLPETTDKSAQVENIADNYKLTYYAIPTKDNPEVTPVDITNYGKVSWAKTPSTVVDTPSNNETITAPVSISFAPDSVVVKNGYVKGGTQTVDLNLDLTGATAKNTDLGFSKKSIDNGLTQTQFKRLVDTTALDNAGIDYTLSWAETPTTKTQNNGVVRVTYPSVMQADGTTPAYLDIPVQYKVNDPAQTADDVDVTYPTTAVEANKAATITPVITDNDGKTVAVPEGTKFAIDGNAPAGATIDSSTGVVTIPATNTTGVTTVPVTVTYPDGSTTQTTVKSVSVATNDDVKNPTSPYDMIKDPANLPAGTKVTWADDNTPTAGDNVPAKVIVTVPGAEPIEVTGTAHYDDSAIYTPQVKNPVQATAESLPDAAEQILNKDKLPEGTTYAWQDGQQVPVTADQTIPGVIVVTYPDGSTDKVSTTITTSGITDADQYTPEAATDLTTIVGKVPEAAKAIANADQMPEGTTYAWTTEPDVSKVGETTGVVTVTYPDGTTDTVTVPVTVKGAEEVDKTALQQAVDEAPTVEKTPAYRNGTDDAKKAYDDAVAAGKKVLDNPDATQAQVDDATNAINKAKGALDGKPDSDTYTPEASTDVKVPVGGQVPDAETTITNAKDMPEGTTYEWTKTPDTSKVGETTGEITVTYPDGTTDKVTVPVTVEGADKTDLQKAVDDAPTVEKTPAYINGTDEAKKAYDDAVAAGKSVLDNPDATQDEVDKATKAIEDAKTGLDGKIIVNPYYPATSSSASEANSAADVAKSNASSAASNASTASSAASAASSAAEKNSAAKSDADKASSAASVASSAAEKASSAASTASSAASDADKQKSIASEQDSIASSAASAGDSTAASEAQSKASEAADKASSDAEIAKSAASESSSAASAASSAASTASDAASAAESEANKKPIDVTPYEPVASSSADVASSAASQASSSADKASSANSDAQSNAAKASSAAEKNSAAKSDADKASSAASVASSAAEKASSAASTASSAASDADVQKSIASEQDSIASSAASAGNSSAASEAQSKASDAAKKASEDADIAKSAASEASSAQSTASSAASTASDAASAAESEANKKPIDVTPYEPAASSSASEANSAADVAKSNASSAASNASNASSAASAASSAAEKNSAAKSDADKASSAASVASSAAEKASSAASTASSAASDADVQKSIASEQDSIASSAASAGNSSAASEAQSKASDAAKKASEDADIAKSAASESSSAASEASSASSTASSAASEATSIANSSASSDYASEASSAASDAKSHASDASNSSSAASSSASEAKSNADKDPNNSTASSAASTASSAASTASSASSTASSAAKDASSAASTASSAQSAASSYASEGNSSAASSAESVASSAASQAKSDDSVASSAASTASSAASVASSAASTASSAASEGSSSADSSASSSAASEGSSSDNSSAASSANSDYASEASSAASEAGSHASDASSSSSNASSAASEAKSNADKDPNNSKASSAASTASSAASEASSAALTASDAASDASSAASTASSAQSAASSYASEGNSSAASSAESVASSAASQAKSDDSVASSAASKASSAASTASSAASEASSAVNPGSSSASSDYASQASSAASEAGSHASNASSSASHASSSASEAKSNADKNPTDSAAKSDANKASSAASVASSAASTASSAATDASNAASTASSAQSAASSYASQGNSSAASSAESVASSAASQAKSDASVASSAASVASSAASTASEASSAVNDDLNPSSAASSAATNAGKYASEASSSASVASSAASVASSAAATDPTNSQVASDASVASSASSVASSAASTAGSAASAASSAASEANKAQQEADSYAKDGNSSAATSAHAKAQSYASDAKSDESVASSAASVASSAAEVAKSAADDAEKAAQADNNNTGDNTDNPQQPTDNNNNGKSDNNNSDNKDNTGKNTDKGNQGKDNTNKGTTGNNPAGKGDNNKGAGTNQSAPVITNNPTNFAGNNASDTDSLLDAQRPLSEQAEALAEEGYVVTVGPHGQIIDYYPAADGQGMIIYVDANGNVIGKVKVGKAGQLPQTGAKNNEAGIFGLALASIAGFFGLAAGKKRKKND